MRIVNLLRRYYPCMEWTALFVLLPLALYFFSQRWLTFAALWLAALLAVLWLVRQPGFSWRVEWNMKAVRQAFPHILWRFLIVCSALALFTILYDPARLLSFPLQRLQLWLTVMVLYPLLSAAPQEILFRSFFFRRYQSLFPTQRRMIMASAFAFGFAHIMFANWVALLFSFLGGLLLADSYARRRSLAFVWIEHTLYGCFVFTIGLGWYFFAGAVR